MVQKLIFSLIVSFGLLPNLSIAANYQDDDKTTHEKMIDAAYFGYTEELIELLENNKLNINYQDSFGRTAIWYASYWEFIDTMKVILAVEGIDVNIADNGGFYPLETCMADGKWEAVELLLEAGAIDHTEKLSN